MGAGHEEEPSRKPALRGHDGQQLAYPHHTAGTAGRNLQSGGTKPCESIIRCAGYTAEADAVGTLRMLEAVRILGLEKKRKSIRLRLPNCSVWCRRYHRRDNPVLPTQSIWCGQTIRLLDYEELPGKLRHVRRKRHSLQPRKRTARRNLRDTQNYTGSCTRIAQGYQDKLYLGN